MAPNCFVAGLAVVMALLLLLPMISMIAGGVGAVTQSEIDALKEEQRESQVMQQELKNQLADVKEDQAAAQQRRQLLQQQLEAINAELDSIKRARSPATRKSQKRRSAGGRGQEQAQYELFCERVRAMEEEGTVSYWSILFNAENFSDMLDRLADIDAVMDYDNQVMEELTAARQELERLQAELESARAEEQAARTSRRPRRQSSRPRWRRPSERRTRSMPTRRSSTASWTTRWRARRRSRRRSPGSRSNWRRSAGKTMSPSTGRPTPHRRCPRYYRLTSLFGYRIPPHHRQAHSHTGIDIPAPGGTPIQACKSGQVVTSAYHYSYGNYVVIDHGNGNSTSRPHEPGR